MGFFDDLKKKAEELEATLQSINSLAASSPFKDLNDIGKVTQNLSMGGEWDI